MDRTEPKGSTVLSVRRAFVRSRIESQFSASAYERVVPPISQALANRRPQSRTDVASSRLAATGA